MTLNRNFIIQMTECKFIDSCDDFLQRPINIKRKKDQDQKHQKEKDQKGDIHDK